MVTLSANTMLANRYRIEKLLSQGGMGMLYRAFDTNLEIAVAIKENFYATQEAVVQFKHEALILAKLRHPALPRVIHYFADGGKQYLVMDFIEGIDLWEMINQTGYSLSERQAINYILQVCDILLYLHSQSPPIIHRDIKPQNIKITPDNRAVLVDFGIAKEASTTKLTMAGAKCVTAGFSPLEQYVGTGTTPASDIYALGATLYTLLTQQIPPDSITLLTDPQKLVPIEQLNPLVTTEIAEAINWAMALKADERPQSVQLWQEKLRSIYDKQASNQHSRDLNVKIAPPTRKLKVVSLVRGGNVSLTTVEPNLKQVLVGLGWDAPSKEGMELDSSVLLLKADGKVRNDNDLIFYNNPRSSCGAVVHHGAQPAAGADKETIQVDFFHLPAEVTKLIFAVSIYEGNARQQHFAMLNSAFIRLMDQESGREVVRYDLAINSRVETAIIFAELYRYRGQWKFRAIGQGFKDGLGPLARHFGVEVS